MDGERGRGRPGAAALHRDLSTPTPRELEVLRHLADETGSVSPSDRPA